MGRFLSGDSRLANAKYPPLSIGYGALVRCQRWIEIAFEDTANRAFREPTCDRVSVLFVSGALLAHIPVTKDRWIDLDDYCLPSDGTQPSNGQKCTCAPTSSRMRFSQGMPACVDFATDP